MTVNYTQYDNPLLTRYASREMMELWSPQKKFSTWRRLWVALAEAEAELGLPVSAEADRRASGAYRRHRFRRGRTATRRRFRHDVMAHVHAYGDVCPDARAIIHLGATSCYVTDNTDLLLLREGLEMVRCRVVAVIERLAAFAEKYRDLPCLGFTHFQPAQPTTVGKRACLWAYDFVLDLQEIEFRLSQLKGPRLERHDRHAGELFGTFRRRSSRKPRQLDELICRKIGFESSLAVSGQTYTRKIDFQVLAVLSGIAQSAHKMATDIRLLAHRKEVEEPFEKEQIGSSAMAYKRNPMRSERICSLARFVMSMEQNAAQTIAVQWLERTLDDSANRRLSLPQSFLATDAVLILCQNVTSGLGRLSEGDRRPSRRRTAVHGHRKHPDGGRCRRRRPSGTARTHPPAQPSGGESRERRRRPERSDAAAGRRSGVRQSRSHRRVMNPAQFVGRAPQQVDEFLAEVIEPIRAKYGDDFAERGGSESVVFS